MCEVITTTTTEKPTKEIFIPSKTTKKPKPIKRTKKPAKTTEEPAETTEAETTETGEEPNTTDIPDEDQQDNKLTRTAPDIPDEDQQDNKLTRTAPGGDTTTCSNRQMLMEIANMNKCDGDVCASSGKIIDDEDNADGNKKLKKNICYGNKGYIESGDVCYASCEYGFMRDPEDENNGKYTCRNGGFKGSIKCIKDPNAKPRPTSPMTNEASGSTWFCVPASVFIVASGCLI